MSSSQNIINIYSDIIENTTFYKDNIYIINGEIRVREGVVLIIENNTKIYIKNGYYPKSILKKSVLIFNSGSSLIGEDIYILSCNKNNQPNYVRNNGGVWFLGSVEAIKEGIISNYITKHSNFDCHKIYTYYLGSKDPNVQNNNNVEPSADNDGITILGCSEFEWKCKGLYIFESGDNGLDMKLSTIMMEELEIYRPGEDAINLQSSHLTISKKLVADVSLTSVYDRDIFDFETDQGPAYLRIQQYCYVKIVGIFGDQLKLVSDDLPQPTDKLYNYEGYTYKGQSYIYTQYLD